MLKKNVRFLVLNDTDIKSALDSLNNEFTFLDENEKTETSFLIFPESFGDFNFYLDLVDRAEAFLKKKNYEGVYQLASFHPQYCFAGADENDAANYTSRSPYPMLHILREESITKALENFPDPESIPERNIRFAKEKGLEYMKQLLYASMQ